MARGVSEAEANLGSLDTVIVTEVGGVLVCVWGGSVATRRCSSGVEFAAASHGTRRF